MIDWNKPIELNDGTPYKVVHVFSDGSALVVNSVRKVDYFRAYQDGSATDGNGTGHGIRFRNTPPPKRKGTVWVNVWPDCGGVYNTKEEAQWRLCSRTGVNALAGCIEVPWEEGQGL